jgi:hypothetical protein
MPVLEKYKVLNLVDNGEQRDSVGSTTRMKQARAFFAQQAAANPLTRFYNRIDSADITPNGYVTRWFQDLNVREPLAEVVFLAASRSCSNPNNGSVVVRFKYGETKILVTGDAEDEADGGCLPAIPRMIQQLSDGTLDVDVYKVGHHASPNGTNLEYLQEMSPRISVISAGGPQDSDAIGFGHPRIDTIRLIMDGTSGSRTPPKAGYGLTASRQRHGVREDLTISKAVYCTCWDGDIQIPTDAAGRLLPVITSR